MEDGSDEAAAGLPLVELELVETLRDGLLFFVLVLVLAMAVLLRMREQRCGGRAFAVENWLNVRSEMFLAGRPTKFDGLERARGETRAKTTKSIKL